MRFRSARSASRQVIRTSSMSGRASPRSSSARANRPRRSRVTRYVPEGSASFATTPPPGPLPTTWKRPPRCRGRPAAPAAIARSRSIRRTPTAAGLRARRGSGGARRPRRASAANRFRRHRQTRLSRVRACPTWCSSKTGIPSSHRRTGCLPPLPASASSAACSRRRRLRRRRGRRGSRGDCLPRHRTEHPRSSGFASRSANRFRTTCTRCSRAPPTRPSSACSIQATAAITGRRARCRRTSARRRGTASAWRSTPTTRARS